MLPFLDVSCMRFPNILRHLKVPFRFTSMVLSMFSSVISSIPHGVGITPALQTRQSNLP